MCHGELGTGKMEDKDFNQKLYERLVDVIGTEEDVHSRRDFFRIMDTINAFGDEDSISVSSGSLPEGFDIEGSDEDVTNILKNVHVIPFGAEVEKNEDNLKVFMEVDKEHKGYATLYLPEDEESFVMTKGDSEHTELLYIKECLEHVNGKCILSSSRFREQFMREGLSNHGPCLTDGDHDFAFALRGSAWPEIVRGKDRRLACKSKQRITEEFLAGLLSDFCIYVPVGPKVMGPQDSSCQTLWRMSFMMAEKRFIKAMSHIQFLCYGLLKIVLKERIAKPVTDNIISSYILKTGLFWLIDESDNDEKGWNQDQLYFCFLQCISKLIDFVEACNCPNYFLPSSNLFFGKVATSNKSDILKILLEVKNGGYEVLSSCKTLGQFMVTSRVTEAERESKLDLMCSRVLHVYPFDEEDLLKQALEAMETENSQETRSFQKGVIGIQISSLYRQLAQMIDVTKDDDTCEKLRLQKECLRKACESEPLTASIQLGSFHVTRGDYRTAIEILESVSQKLNPEKLDVVLRREPKYSADVEDHYRKTFCGQGLSLQDKWREAMVGDIVFLENSTLVPEEFEQEVSNHRPLCMAPPAVYLHALLFLCYHHLSNEQKVQETLKTLEHILEMGYLIRNVVYSRACVFVGACYETCRDYGSARKYYLKACKAKLPSIRAKCRLDRLERDLKKTGTL